MALNPCLIFDGNAEEALEYYRDALGGELVVLRYEGSPAESHVSPDLKSKVMHGRLQSALGTVMASDGPCPERKNDPTEGSNVSIALHPESAAQAESVFNKLAAGGTVRMPLDKTFFAERFGMLVDRFGVAWMVNYAPDAD